MACRQLKLLLIFLIVLLEVDWKNFFTKRVKKLKGEVLNFSEIYIESDILCFHVRGCLQIKLLSIFGFFCTYFRSVFWGLYQHFVYYPQKTDRK